MNNMSASTNTKQKIFNNQVKKAQYYGYLLINAPFAK